MPTFQELLAESQRREEERKKQQQLTTNKLPTSTLSEPEVVTPEAPELPSIDYKAPVAEDAVRPTYETLKNDFDFQYALYDEFRKANPNEDYTYNKAIDYYKTRNRLVDSNLTYGSYFLYKTATASTDEELSSNKNWAVLRDRWEKLPAFWQAGAGDALDRIGAFSENVMWGLVDLPTVLSAGTAMLVKAPLQQLVANKALQTAGTIGTYAALDGVMGATFNAVYQNTNAALDLSNGQFDWTQMFTAGAISAASSPLLGAAMSGVQSIAKAVTLKATDGSALSEQKWLGLIVRPDEFNDGLTPDKTIIARGKENEPLLIVDRDTNETIKDENGNHKYFFRGIDAISYLENNLEVAANRAVIQNAPAPEVTQALDIPDAVTPDRFSKLISRGTRKKGVDVYLNGDETFYDPLTNTISVAKNTKMSATNISEISKLAQDSTDISWRSVKIPTIDPNGGVTYKTAGSLADIRRKKLKNIQAVLECVNA